jgi:hypothetical protein
MHDQDAGTRVQSAWRQASICRVRALRIGIVCQLCVSLLCGCNSIEPKTTFRIVSTDRPVKSAVLKLCGHDFPLAEANGMWEASVHTPGDCDGGVDAAMVDGSSVFCKVGYVTNGLEDTWSFRIQEYACAVKVTYKN